MALRGPPVLNTTNPSGNSSVGFHTDDATSTIVEPFWTAVYSLAYDMAFTLVVLIGLLCAGLIVCALCAGSVFALGRALRKVVHPLSETDQHGSSDPEHSSHPIESFFAGPCVPLMMVGLVLQLILAGVYDKANGDLPMSAIVAWMLLWTLVLALSLGLLCASMAVSKAVKAFKPSHHTGYERFDGC